MSDTAFIMGGGGHAHVIASILHSRYQKIQFLELNPTLEGSMSQEDFFRSAESYQNADVFIGIGSNAHRTSYFKRLLAVGITPANCIADGVFVAHDATLGRGCVVCPGAVIGSRAHLGDNTIVNTLSSVDHDCRVGTNSQITAGVILGGGTVIGQDCFFGIASATIPGVKIGDRTQVMAGSLVSKDVPSDVLVGGSPARIMKRLSTKSL